MNQFSPEVKEELLQRADVEQALRLEWDNHDTDEYRQKVLAHDIENTAFLKELVDQSGWPKISEVGQETAMAAWVIAQHSPDKKFRKQCLDLMLAVPDEVEPQNIARTIDRVRIDEGRKQYFGTHFMRGDDGTWVPMPIDDPVHVEQRRTEYKLPTLEEKIREYNQDN